MSVWNWLGGLAEGGAGAAGAVFEWLGGLLSGIGDPATRRQVAFSVALIALSAKMAKADGVVTASEVGAFRGMFAVPVEEQRNVARLFDLAKRDVAGYDAYATRVAQLYGHDREALVDVLDGLFVIAKADGAVHEAELAYLESVGEIMGFAGADFEAIEARHVIAGKGDPYLVLGADRSWPLDRIRRRYLELVAANHPDRAMARGLPEEFLAIATARMAAVNDAWARIEAERRLR